MAYLCTGKVSDREIRDVARKAGLTRSQLKNLYKELGLADHEVENAERNADTADGTLQADKVLHHWRTTRGCDANKQAILDALKECNYEEAIAFLTEKWEIIREVGETGDGRDKILHFTPCLSNEETFTLHLGSAVSPLCLL